MCNVTAKSLSLFLKTSLCEPKKVEMLWAISHLVLRSTMWNSMYTCICLLWSLVKKNKVIWTCMLYLWGWIYIGALNKVIYCFPAVSNSISFSTTVGHLQRPLTKQWGLSWTTTKSSVECVGLHAFHCAQICSSPASLPQKKVWPRPEKKVWF